jgi:subtilisin family serine protease
MNRLRQSVDRAEAARRHVQAVLTALMLSIWLPLSPGALAQQPPAIPAELIERAQLDGSIRVIVELGVDVQPEGDLALPAQAAQRQTIASAQQQLVAALPSGSLGRTQEFVTVPYLALTVSPAALAVLGRHPLVRRVTEDLLVSPTLAQSVPLVQGPQAWSAGFDGTGWSVAILDTGVDKNHSFLSGKVVEEACYSFNNSCPNGSTSQVGPGAGVPCPYAPADCSHGTHVAGIAAGTSASFSGVGKGASVIAVQVFSQFSCGGSPCALATTGDIMLGLERVYDLRNTRQIAAANMSLGGGQYFSQSACDAAWPGVKSVIDNLRSVGIATVISSGNNGFTDSLSGPGCISTAVSVGSTTKSDTVSSFSNSATFLSLLAPGQSINSSVPGGGFAFFSGTSMAAPHVTGAWSIGKQHSPSASVSAVLAAFRASTTSIVDPRNGVSVPRLEIATALAALNQPPAAFSKTSPSSGAVSQPTSLLLTWASSIGAASYEYCIDTTNDGACAAWTSVGAATSAFVGGLAGSTAHYWQVRATNANGTTYANGSAAAFWSFTTGPSLTDIISNGSFAAGSAGWVISGGFFADSRFAGCLSCPGHAYLSNFDGTAGNNLSGSLYQTVTIPAGATSAQLSYWHHITTQETTATPFDQLTVTVRNTSGTVLQTLLVLSNANSTPGYVQRTADLTAYAGQSIRIQFTGSTDVIFPTLFRIDEVSLQVISPPGAFAKAAPTDAATNLSISPTLSWGASANATSYEYCIDTTNDNACSSWTSTGTNTSVGLAGLAGGTTHYWQVRANNAVGTTYANGSATAFWSFTTANPPGAFGKTNPANGAAGVTPALAWGTSSGATSYEYCLDTTNDNACSSWTNAGANTGVTVAGLTGNTTYYWQVRAQGLGGTTFADGSSTAFWSFTTGSLPNAPTNLTHLVNGSSVQFNWQAPASGPSPLTYVIEAGSTSGGITVQVVTTGSIATSHLVVGVPNGTYYVRVRAQTAFGLGPASNEVVVTVNAAAVLDPCVSAPAAPGNLMFSVTGPSVALTWNASAGAWSYRVEVGSTSGSANVTVVDTGSAGTGFFARVNPGTYYVRVRAQNRCGLSPPSSEITVVVP